MGSTRDIMRAPTDRRVHQGRSRRRPRNAVAIGCRLGAAGLIAGLAIVSTVLPATQVADAATLPVVTCTSNPNIFNTGYDAATKGVLPNGSQDANWQVAGEFDTPNGTTPPSAVSLPPAGATFAPANVGRLTTLWSPSPVRERPVDLPANSGQSPATERDRRLVLRVPVHPRSNGQSLDLQPRYELPGRQRDR